MHEIQRRSGTVQHTTPVAGKTFLVYAIALSLSAMALCGVRAQEPSFHPLVGAEWAHVVSAGESWEAIGARVGVSPAVLASRNGRGLRPALRGGETIVIDNRHIIPDHSSVTDENTAVNPGVTNDGLIVNVPQRLVFFFAEGRLVAHYPTAVGPAGWQTPLGDFTIVLKEEDPTWDVPISIQQEMRRAGKRVVKSVPPGPDNPLGRFWLGLSLDSVGIHGTTAPLSIYAFATHGCIRLHPDDIEALYQQVAIGERGRIIYEPVLVSYDGTDVYLEVHPDPYRRAPDTLARALELLDQAGLSGLSDTAEVARAVRQTEGLATPVTILTRASAARAVPSDNSGAHPQRSGR
jgi:L,D-transpeptidase ErfK/SrfK